jgi:hypothetical protein
VVKIKRKIPVAAPHPPSLAAGSPLSRDAGEGAERSEAGEGTTVPSVRFAPLGLAAAGALICFGLQRPGSALTAAGADEPLRPTALEKAFCARVFSRKATLKFD